MRLRPLIPIVLASLALTGCLQLFGQQELVTESKSQEKKALEDDKIEDKVAAYDASMRVVDRFGEVLVTLNKSAAVIKLDVGPMDSNEDKALAEKIFPTYEAALAAMPGPVVPSLEIVGNKLKAFNDRFYAGVELAMQEGIVEVYAGKKTLYLGLFDALVAAGAAAPAAHQPYYQEAAAWLAAGLSLGGASPTIPVELQAQVSQLVAQFEELTLLSRPIGFYTWSPELGYIFAQDRFFQQMFGGPPNGLYKNSPSFGALLAMADVLGQDTTLHRLYEAEVKAVSSLTNPFVAYTLLELVVLTPAALNDPDGAWAAFSSSHAPTLIVGSDAFTPVALLPSSTSPETRLFERIFPDGIPEGVELMDALIEAILTGDVDLAPLEGSGWYDYQLYALETLLLPEKAPESSKLLLTKAYKEKLIETFKTLITQTRETHVKQLNMGGEGASAPVPTLEIYPVLHAEPFASYYLRQARAYRFVKIALGSALGSAFLDNAMAFDESGLDEIALAQRLDEMIRLTYGLYIFSLEDIGLEPILLADELAEYPLEDCRKAALLWLSGSTDALPRQLDYWRRDADVLQDPRVIVPVEANERNSTMVYWAVIGVKAIRIRAEYMEGYLPEVVSCDFCAVEGFIPNEPYLLMGKQIELALPTSVKPPTREEFRALCDKNQTEDEIVKALEALQ